MLTDGPSSTDQDEDVDYITIVEVEGATVCSVKKNFAKEIYSQMLIDDTPVKFQVDCGSSINILPKSLVDKRHLTPTSKTLIMWNKKGSRTIRHSKNCCHEPREWQEILRRVRCGVGKSNSFDRCKSCTTHEVDNRTLGKFQAVTNA